MTDDQDIFDDDQPMGEGRAPEKELLGWKNKESWGGVLSSEVGLDVPEEHWKENPKDHINEDPLVQIGETEKKKIPVFASKADNNPSQTDGILIKNEDRD